MNTSARYHISTNRISVKLDSSDCFLTDLDRFGTYIFVFFTWPFCHTFKTVMPCKTKLTWFVDYKGFSDSDRLNISNQMTIHASQDCITAIFCCIAFTHKDKNLYDVYIDICVCLSTEGPKTTRPYMVNVHLLKWFMISSVIRKAFPCHDVIVVFAVVPYVWLPIHRNHVVSLKVGRGWIISQKVKLCHFF